MKVLLHVGKHIQNPFQETKGMFDKVHKAKMNYELAKQDLITKTAPTRAVLDRVSQIHNLDQAPVSMNTGPMQPNPMDAPMDPNGMMQTGGGMQPQPGMLGQPNMGNRMNDPLGTDPAMGQEVNQGKAGTQMDPATRNPQNMSQTPGQMNQNRPSKAGFQPGVSPGPAQSVVPRKMGMPQPGESKVGQKAGYPGGQASNPQAEQYGPVAPKPKGAGQLPGAKGPGDLKVQNKIKKAQNNPNRGSGGESTGKQINIKIHGDAIKGGRDSMASMLSTSALHSCDSGKMIKSYGTSDGVKKAWDSRNRGGSGNKGSGSWQRNTGRGVGMDKETSWETKNFRDKMATHTGGVMQAREFTQSKRKQLAKTGAAMPGGGFPIVNKSDLANARQAIGRAKNPSAARAHIRNRAKALGVKLDSTWKKEMAAFTGGVMPHGTVARPAGGSAMRPSGGMPSGGAMPARPSGGGGMRPMIQSRGMKFKMTNLTQE